MKVSEHIQLTKRSVSLLFSLSRAKITCLLLGSFTGAVMPYVPVWFSARLLDCLYEGREAGTLALYVLLTVGLVFLLSLARAYLDARCRMASTEMYRNENWKYSEKAMQMAYESIEDPEVAHLRDRIQRETQVGYNIYRLFHSLEGIVGHVTRIGISLWLTAPFFLLKTISAPARAAFAAGLALTVLCKIITTRKVEELNNQYYSGCVHLNMLGSKFHAYLDDYHSGKDIRIYGMSEGLTAYSAALRRETFRMYRKKNRKQAEVQIANVAMSRILQFGLYVLLFSAALKGGVSVGSIARYVSCVLLLLEACSGLAASLQTALVNQEYMKRYFSYFDIQNHMYQGSLTVEKRDDNDYHVEFRDVSFRYPHTREYALRHVNLRFKAGEKLAVVGANGSGKTTFIKLMCRLYDPTEGEILLNGVNIRKYDYDEYLSIFSVVFQDFRLFSFTLGENVAGAGVNRAEKYDGRRVERCLEQAGLGKRLDTLERGLDTFLYKDCDDGGVEISGGEAQKIALARALYKDAPFMILDEPTAALDPVSEYEVFRKFNEIAGDKTAVYISHRLASCRFCDKIAVFDEGRVVQTGSHEELLAQEGGRYHELWHAQAQYYG